MDDIDEKRLQLQRELQNLIGVRQDGKANVYFQPPESIKLNYNCIVYSKTKLDAKYADNKLYNYTQCYEITIIHENPDNELYIKLLRYFERISYDRRFISDNMYHDVLNLYY